MEVQKGGAAALIENVNKIADVSAIGGRIEDAVYAKVKEMVDETVADNDALDRRALTCVAATAAIVAAGRLEGEVAKSINDTGTYLMIVIKLCAEAFARGFTKGAKG